MPTTTAADIAAVSTYFARPGNKQNEEIRSALTKMLADLTTPTTLTLAAFDDDTAAGVGGLAAGDMYQTTGSGASPLDAAGIVLVKQ